ncbi:hypothetical protein NCAS_0D04700 [Naumovozyma castellii]|uniref:DNA mismatch repair protein MSH3 n=1 Tax=Naumovozyma castellii TaxID=27288 RepID=G0VER0_NAUCA|nr:hypothetical protein NCAS_0D04700 [Naumovozyma castellii CBS 4309]CCC70051.1 hypothetical protein NCAS_0D04700 [Naumovozyma castellii CBS 4309]
MKAQPVISKFFKNVAAPSGAKPVVKNHTMREEEAIGLPPATEDSDVQEQVSIVIDSDSDSDSALNSVSDSNLEKNDTVKCGTIELHKNIPYSMDAEASPETTREASKSTRKRSRNNVAAKSLEENVEPEQRVPENDDVRPSRKKKAKISKSKLTPLDQQIQELKSIHKNKLLVVRVGYKYKCFAEDAIIASKILKIKLVPGKLTIDESNPADKDHKQFAYCSFPDTRLNVHLERLIYNNCKVGVVEQAETSAIKKNSQTSNKSQVFERKITGIFSKATYGVNSPHDLKGGNNLLGNTKSIWALNIDESLAQQKRFYSLLSVNLNSGEVIYDEFFEPLHTLYSLKERIKYLEPVEIVTLKPLPRYVDILFNESNCKVTINEIENTNEAIQSSLKIVANKLKFSLELSKLLETLYIYLQEYNNERILFISTNFAKFLANQHMTLSDSTLEGLDILRNDGEKGSLLWLLDHTRTSFGLRKLRDWVLHPLRTIDKIEERLDAIECILKEINCIFLESFNQLLKGLPDLLRTLNRIAYGHTSKKEVYFFLKQMCSIGDHFKTHSSYIKEQVLSPDGRINKQSQLLTSILKDIENNYQETHLPQLFAMINVAAVMNKNLENQKTEFFNLNNYDNPDGIIKIQRDIEDVKSDLSAELKHIRKVLGRPYLNYKDEIEYLIEVKNTQVTNLPSDWIKINNTLKISRFATPTTTKLVEKLQFHKDLLVQEVEKEYQRFLSKINDEYIRLRNIIENIATYDCLLSLSAVSCNIKYTRPIFSNEKQVIKLKGARNPIIESLDINYVPNDTDMNRKDGLINIISGPNMGGKSSYIRQVALLIILAQIGSFVPADYMEVSIFDNILTRIGAHDDLLRGESTFKKEMLDVLQVLENCTKDSLVLLDEVGRGTGTLDGKAISYSLINYFMEETDCPLILFTSHFPILGTIKSPLVKCYHMDYVEEKRPGENWSSVTFLYKLKSGFTTNSYGLNVAKLASIDKDIINEAYEISESMKNEEEKDEYLELPLFLKEILKGRVATETFQNLLNYIEED